MTLPTTRPITLGQVCTEFSAPATTHLGAFLRGGAWVPNTAGNAGVPTSLPISLGDLLGASAATPLSANVNSTTTTGLRSGTGLCTTIINTVVTASGGTSPYTYLWQRVSGSASIYATSSASATTKFYANLTSYPQTLTGVWRCRVTDAASTIVYCPNVSVSLTNNI